MKSIFLIFFIFFIFINVSYCQYDNAMDRGGSHEWDGDSSISWKMLAKSVEILSIPVFIILIIIGLKRDLERWKNKRNEKKIKLQKENEATMRLIKRNHHLASYSTRSSIKLIEDLYREGKITKEQFEESKEHIENNY